MNGNLTLNLRSQRLVVDDAGYRVWRVDEEIRTVAPERTALILCDIWNGHWCRGAVERLEKMVPRLNALAHAARDRGVTIVHAPSNRIDAYEGTPARRRAVAAPAIEMPRVGERPDPPMPFVATLENCCDTPGDVARAVHTAQHEGIDIDHGRDLITDQGRECLNAFAQRGIEQVVITGIHTNFCILNRTFGIKAMVRWGVPITLTRDLTDCCYDPGEPPYVSHDEGTRLVVGYIEKFWCPTLLSGDLMG